MDELKLKIDNQKDKSLSRIHSVLEYLCWVKTINPVIGAGGLEWQQTHMYYRGQANDVWGLLPGLFRKDSNDTLLEEYKLLKRARLRFWNTLSQMPTFLEKLVYLQHFGLPTRLLDVTFNPLVALYMACVDESLHDVDGKVFFGYACDGECPNIVELISRLVFESNEEVQDYHVRDFVEKLGNKTSLADFSRPYFVFPPINNPRIESQDGAFIMAPLLSLDAGGASYCRNVKSLDDTTYFKQGDYVIIDASAKKVIMEELATLGIDSGTIYRDTPHKIEALVKKLKSETPKLL